VSSNADTRIIASKLRGVIQIHTLWHVAVSLLALAQVL